MRNISFILLGLLLLFFACDNESKPKKPSNLIPRDKMENILYDLYIVNAAKGTNKKVLEKNNVIPETYILTKYGIDSLQFAESNSYYAFDSEEYRKMVDNVKTRLQDDKEYFEDLQKKEGEAAKKRRDSLGRARRQSRDSIQKTMKIQDDN
ncbi:DUF4296 domain-containing protein [Winogradskyella sp.]|uniref:DUF4296 domain-containing protein n=1 Tax=Winogradskyella sp. TaxID=1883156 RepID=UPI002618A07A|nr:DUF4296 domain-containing protein [Winogradskyella sp.]